MSFLTLLFAALAGGILRLIVLPRGKWCTKKDAILSGGACLSFAFSWSVLLLLFEAALSAKLSQWQPIGLESQAVQALSAAFLGWHMSANLVNAITFATLTESELMVLKASQSRLRSLLARLPSEEIRLNGDELVLFPLVSLSFKVARRITETEIMQLRKENQWLSALPKGFDFHYGEGIVRVLLGPLPSFDWKEPGGKTRSRTVKAQIKTEIEALAAASRLLEERFPECAVPLLGPPRFRSTGV